MLGFRMLTMLMLGIVLVLAACGDDEDQPREEPLTDSEAISATVSTTTSLAPTTTSTAVSTTTTIEAEASVSGPLTDPLEGVEVIAAAWTDRDLTQLSGVAAEGLIVTDGPFRPPLEPFSEFYWAIDSRWDIGDCSAADNIAVGDHKVTCSLSVTDGFLTAGELEFSGGSLVYVLEDGYITSLAVDMVGPNFETFDDYVSDFLTWLETNHSDAFFTTIDPSLGQIYSAEAAEVYLDYVNEWLESRG